MSKPKITSNNRTVNNSKSTDKLIVSKNIFFKKHSKIIAYLVIITVLFVPVYNHIFDKKVALLGDNAAYYIFAKGLTNGDGYVNTHIYGKPKAVQYPPGYPAFMAIVMKTFGDSVLTMKKANGFLLWASLIILFFFFKNISKNIHLSFVITILLIFNMHLLQYSTWMMSEIPFLFISTLALLLLTITNTEKKPWQSIAFIMSIITASGAYYVRGQGLAVFAGIVLFLLIEKKWLHAIISTAMYFLLLIPWQMRNSGLGESPYTAALRLKNYYNPAEGDMQLGDWFTRFFNNMERYFSHEIPSSIFGYSADYQGSGHLTGGIIISAIVIFALFKLTKYRWAVGGYVLATLGILFLWPEIWYGIRFILALVPILLFLFAYGILEIIAWIGSKIKVKNLDFITEKIPWGFLILVFVLFGKLELLHKEADKKVDPLFRNYYAMAQWTKNNLSDTAVIICRKPDLFYLESGHYVDGFTKVDDMKEFLVSLDKKKATHIVVYGDGITQRFFIPVYEKNPEKFMVVQQFKNPDVWLLSYNPSLGYNGDWNNGNREGNGTYCYPDGRKYVGEWKNNTMNGKGKIYDADGNIIAEGEWQNGLLINQ